MIIATSDERNRRRFETGKIHSWRPGAGIFICNQQETKETDMKNSYWNRDRYGKAWFLLSTLQINIILDYIWETLR